MIAKDRIAKLLSMAKDSVMGKRYIKIAKRIGMRTRTRLPKLSKRQICKACGAPLVPGKNSSIRVLKGKLSVRCKECGGTTTTPFK